MNEGLKNARMKAEKTQAQLAKDAGISEVAYQLYEYGKREPGVKTAIRIADALGVTDLRELFGDERKEQSEKQIASRTV